MSTAPGPQWQEIIGQWRRISADDLHYDVEIPPPASASDIRQVETRLGITLPVELAALYALADGLPSLGGRFVGVRGCAELGWFRDTDAELIEILDDINAQSFDGVTGLLSDDLEIMRAGLAISKDGDGYRLFCVPTAPEQAWQFYQHTDDGGGLVAKASLAGPLLALALPERAGNGDPAGQRRTAHRMEPEPPGTRAAGTARPGSSPPPPQSLIAEARVAEGRRRHERRIAQSYARGMRERGLPIWGHPGPAERLRALGYPDADRPTELMLANQLADEVGGVDDETLRRIARWLARGACERAGSSKLAWQPALDALEENRPLPAPFDDVDATWDALYPSTAFDDSRRNPPGIAFAAPAAALTALIAAAAPDAITAFLLALNQAALSVDDPAALVQDVRRQFTLDPPTGT